MSEAQSGFMAFRPRARILKLIGEELISDEVVALTELVKNAHDADARKVIIRFTNVTTPDGEIEVVDDGCGMDRESLLGGWMEPAASTKGSEEGRRTRKGRRVLGEKGVGRFAADKLGRTLELVSLRSGTNGEVHAYFDWDQFDSEGEMLSDVKNRWEIKPAAEISGHGTILKIKGLRQVWSERLFRRLSNRLSRLRPPFKGGSGFTIRIESDEFPDYAGELSNGFLDKAPYRIEGDFDGTDTLRVLLDGKKGIHPTSTVLGALTCGPVRIRLHAFDLETEAIAKIGPRMEARAWLREWSGVSVYRDGFRIWPYGEPHDDWLRLDQRRVNNPVVRLSNNQVVGFVEISRDGNPELFDQTNREGLMNNQALADLRRLLEYTFQLLEAERQRIRHPASARRSESRRKKKVDLPVADAIESLSKLADRTTAARMRQIAGEARESIARQDAEKAHLIHGYNDLAAAGLVADGVAHAALRTLGEAFRVLEELRSKIRTPGIAAVARRLEGPLRDLNTQLITLGGVATGGSHRRRAMDVVAETHAFISTMRPFLEEREVNVVVNGGKQLVRVDMNPQSFQRALHALTTNSLDWLVRTEQPRIEITVTQADGQVEIGFGDNGPGITKAVAPRVFDPMFSLKEGGRGMGLTVARGLIEQHAGTLDLVVDGRRRGALFKIRLQAKRSRATVRAR